MSDLDNLKSQFTQWVNNPMTLRVREYLLKERKEMNEIDSSKLFEENAYSQGLTPLESLGLESVMRASVIKGIDAFTDTDQLFHELSVEVSNAED